MKRTATVALQALTVLIGIAVLAFLIWEPTVEGRNTKATLVHTYLTDPFLAYAYAAAAPFFVALYQAFRFWGYARQDLQRAPEAAKSLRTIRYCALALIAFVIGGEAMILPNAGEDRPPALFMGLLVTLGAIAMAAGATVIERASRKRMSQTA